MSNALSIAGALVYGLAGIWGLIIILPIIYGWGGLLLTIVSFSIFPATLLIVPWYEALWHGQWFLVALNYGAPIITGSLIYLGNSVKRDKSKGFRFDKL